MKKTFAAAAFLLLASTAAQAQYQFEYGGRTIRIDPDRGTVSIPRVYDNTGRKSKSKKPAEARSEPAPPPAAAAAPAPTPATAPETAAAPAAPSPSPAPTTAAVAPAPLPPPVQQEAVPPAPPATPAVAAVPPPAPAPAAPPPPATVATAPAAAPVAAPRDPNSPIGVWLTEEKQGKVRIEPCGADLCGYSVDAKSNSNGEQVLVNMRPGADHKWSGRIHDPNSGSTYDSTIAMKGATQLHVQGCAFGGMFCGGQTWTRVN